MLWKLFEMNWAALLSQRFPFFFLQVSLSLGASVFIGAYLRKPTSKEGSRVYLTMGNLNRVCVKTEEMVPVRQQQAGSDWSLSPRALRGVTLLWRAPTLVGWSGLGWNSAGKYQRREDEWHALLAPNFPRQCGKHPCLQNWESTRTWARPYRAVATKKLLPSYKLFLLWVPAGKTGRRWWSWWSHRSNLILQKLSITRRGEITGCAHTHGPTAGNFTSAFIHTPTTRIYIYTHFLNTIYSSSVKEAFYKCNTKCPRQEDATLELKV